MITDGRDLEALAGAYLSSDLPVGWRDKLLALCAGKDREGDGYGGIYQWRTNATATADGSAVLTPSGHSGPGRWFWIDQSLGEGEGGAPEDHTHEIADITGLDDELEALEAGGVGLYSLHASDPSLALQAGYEAGDLLINIPPGVHEIDPEIFGRPRNNVMLRGAGLGITVLKLPSGANQDMFVFDGLSQHCALQDMSLKGNKSLNTSGRGIFFVADATETSTPGVRETYLWAVFRNLLVQDFKETGVHIEPIYYTLFFEGLRTFYNDGHGIYNNSTDNFFTGYWCEGNDGIGLLEEGANNLWSNGKVIWNGSGTPDAGLFAGLTQLPGIYLNGASRVRMSMTEAQDNYREGMVIEDSQDITAGQLILDRNSVNSAGGYDALQILNSSSVTLGGFISNYHATLQQRRPYYVDRPSKGVRLDLTFRKCLKAPLVETRAIFIAQQFDQSSPYNEPAEILAAPTFLATTGSPTFETGPWGSGAVLNQTNRDRYEIPWALDELEGTIELRYNTQDATPADFGRLLQAGGTGSLVSQLLLGWGDGGGQWAVNKLLFTLYYGDGATRVGATLNPTIPFAADEDWFVTIRWKEGHRIALRAYGPDGTIYDSSTTIAYQASNDFDSTAYPTWLVGGDGNANGTVGIRLDDMRVSNVWRPDEVLDLNFGLTRRLPVDAQTTYALTPALS
jgi:hypothetical protein